MNELPNIAAMIKPQQHRLLFALIACLFLATSSGMTHEHVDAFDASCLVCSTGSLTSDDVPAPIAIVAPYPSFIAFDLTERATTGSHSAPFHARAPPAHS
ncbi:MAG: hypothetical protein VW738_12570 [Pseudomonadales bacterium]